jgi:hypothetical protein
MAMKILVIVVSVAVAAGFFAAGLDVCGYLACVPATLALLSGGRR